MQFVDYYKILGVAETATQDDIKKSYRRLARKFHPDVSKEPNAEDLFKRVGEAYEVLKDPARRREYDSLRLYANQDGQFTPPPNWQSHGSVHGGVGGADFRGFSDFFDLIFGRGAASGAYAGEPFDRDVHVYLPLTLEEAHRGGSRDIQIPESNGNVKTLRVKLPRGISPEQPIRLRGQGRAAAPGLPIGDLYLHPEWLPHKLFSLTGRDITLSVPVTPWELVLGATITVPTLDGRVKLTIPVNTVAGQKLRLPGKGLAGSPTGDLYVELQVALPKMVSDKERELYRALAEGSTFDPRAAL